MAKCHAGKTPAFFQPSHPKPCSCAVCYHAPSLFSITWKAVSPFIDPVTKQKIQFIDKGKKEADQMNSLFYMDKMESEVGGGYPGLFYKKAEYEPICRAFDAEVENELRAMEAVMNPSPDKTLAGHGVNDSAHVERALAAIQVSDASKGPIVKKNHNEEDEGFVSASEEA